ncbi:hypothetical protein L218DRAFT_665113 [Marasmius fiardii PR-910]|nr:hypothetical protein L218DRAFT_665113 [Marasmius fiardii PR-910]
MENQDISPTLLCPNCSRSFVPAQSFPPVELARLRANVLPSSTEKSHTRHILEQEKDELKLYDEELDHLDGIVKILKEKRNKLAAQIKERKSWIAGIRRLPVEVLEEIFLLPCSSKNGTLTISKEGLKKTQFTAPPLTLAQVSCHWRNVAFCCPRLWTSIDVSVAQPSSRFEDILHTYFGNSARLPLNVTLRAPDYWRVEEIYRESYLYYLGDDGVALLNIILSQSFRFETLKLSNFNLDHGLSDTPKHTFPLLRRFETDNELEDSNHWLAESLQQAPLLDTASARFPHHVFPLPYSQLTSLTMREVRFHCFDNTLRKCQNLCRLYIDDYYNDSTTQDNNPQPLELPSLQYFFFVARSSPPANESRLPDNISVPQLYQLSVTYSSFTQVVVDHEWPCPAFTFILRSCSSTLRKLSLSFLFHSFTPSSAHRILELLHGLTHLDISMNDDLADSGFVESLLSTLTISGELERVSSIAVPNLTSDHDLVQNS